MNSIPTGATVNVTITPSESHSECVRCDVSDVSDADRRGLVLSHKTSVRNFLPKYAAERGLTIHTIKDMT